MKHPLQFDRIFSDHMVLQRDAKVPVWGSGSEGSVVEVRFSSQVLRTTVRQGGWVVELQPLSAGGPFEMSIRAVGEDDVTPIVRFDVVVGEVFIAGGQSNMELTMKDTDEYEAETVDAFHPLIRCFDVPREPYAGAEWYEYGGECLFSGWEICTPESFGFFPAVAYHFARTLHSSLGIPVGILGCNWGATSASCWMDERALGEDLETAVYLEEYMSAIKTQGPVAYEKNYQIYRNRCRRLHERRSPESHGFPPIGPRSFQRPSGLFHTMLEKTAPYAARGVLWYQGESDVQHGTVYGKLFARMVRNWREAFCNPDLFFLFVQLTAYSNGNESGDEWPILRESQRLAAREVPGSAMVVSMDHGDRDEIHPRHKRPIGERLALCALRKIYGFDLEDSGPVVDSWTLEDGFLRLHFTHADYGLYLRGGTSTGFSGVTFEGRSTPLDARIENSTLLVRIPDSCMLMEIRYGWENYFKPSLYNAHGLPASPFRLDLRSLEA